MNRKKFLTGASIAFAGSLVGNHSFGATRADYAREPDDFLIPPYLRSGDTIGITSPAGYITLPEIQPATALIETWGFNIKVGTTIGKRDFTFGGTDQERIEDFQSMINDPAIHAILCARGGYGAVRIIDKLNFSPLRQHPKWIIGFSDITVFHSHLNRNFGIASLHSKMCNSFPDDWATAEPAQAETIISIQKALSGEPMRYTTIPSAANRLGKAEGRLVGGNLKTLESLSGSSSDIDTRGKILFVEDTNEYLYSIDRMFWNLERTGKLQGLAGLVIGGFKIKPDESADDAFGRTLQEIVTERVKNFNYPVCFDFPVGHQKNNFALKCGIRHELMVTEGGALLAEIPGTRFNG